MDTNEKPAAESASNKRVELTAQEFELIRTALDEWADEYLRYVDKRERPVFEAALAKFGLRAGYP